MAPKPIYLLGIQIHPITVEELNLIIENLIKNQQKAIIAHVNTHAMNLAIQESWFKKFLNDAEIVFSDGAGIILGAKILGSKIPERITYADWMWQFADHIKTKKFTLFFLGSCPGVSKKAALHLEEQIPELKIVGTHHGYFDKTSGCLENDNVIYKINKVKPNILIIGFGMPLQEKWLSANWERIDADIALTGGAVFDYISGELQRAPHLMTKNGFEWLGRLMIEPQRLWKRYLIGNPLFIWRVLLQKFGLLRLD
ncbi:WecB/TagA/CpsF family glycosyltransferase [Chloroflexota bacterium]